LTSALLKKLSKQQTIENAWRVIQENARTSSSKIVCKEIDDFSEDVGGNIRSLCFRLSRKRFEFGQSLGIPIPKLNAHGQKTQRFRPIVLAPVEARIVQRAVLDVLMDVKPLGRYIQTPYSFGGLRKTKTAEPQHKKDNPSAVPAAIKAVLTAIEGGATHFASADIKSFFTRISKPVVTQIIAVAVNDSEFISFFEKAIAVELSNMAELREKASDFPIEEIGVAQGNSLSPLLGNIILAEFDNQMNEGDCRCIRYIDDFIILAPTAKAANARLKKATALLKELGMELSPEKSSKGASPVNDGFEFLGIEIRPGIIRPAVKAQRKVVLSVTTAFTDTRKSFNEFRGGKPLNRSQSLTSTLKRVEGIIEGWGKHYWFCNDNQILEHLDIQIVAGVRGFLGAYRDIRSKLPPAQQHALLGIPALAQLERFPFSYPKAQPMEGRATVLIQA
jgi:RNA-directed DNA polymerase